jgi:restriction system protein
MSYADAAYLILDEAGKPLHYREITRIAIERGLISPQGQTPEATVNARLGTEIQRQGQQSRFVRTAPGTFGIRHRDAETALASPPELLADRRVKVPLFPTYSEVRLILPVWNGRRRAQITGLRAAIRTPCLVAF